VADDSTRYRAARNVRRTRRGLTGLLVIALAIASGAAPIFAAGSPEGEAAAEPAGDTLVFGISGSPDTLDPHATTGTLTFQTMRSVYDTLVEPDHEGTLVPALATEWESREDGREWRFELRRDVVFHDGTPFTSADVVASLDRLRDETFGSPSAHEYRMIESVRPEGDHAVILSLSEPHAPLLATLASGWSAILPAGLIAAGHDFGAHPVGTGPFRFESWTRDGELILGKNDRYWQDGAPLLAGVEFVTITEQGVLAQALMAGQVDVADIVVEPELSMLRQADGVAIYEGTSALVMVLAINTARPPLDDLRVRQGINAAIDKQAVMDTAYAGGQEVATFMDVGNPYYVDFTGIYRHDPVEARDVASDTAFDRELVIAVPRNYEPHVRAAELYHEMLRQAGFPVRLQLVEWSTWLSDVYRDSQFDLTVIGHTGKLDPHGRLAQYGTEDTYVQWVDPPTAEAIEAARRESDPAERRRLYTIALERMARQLPFVFVGSPYRYVGLDAAIEGFHMDSQLDTFDLREVRFVR
jgi:peptide/nickel transport system substrate-binding protein